MTIDGLTKRQTKLLDKMWSLDSIDDYQKWDATLSVEDSMEAFVLSHMIVLADIDEQVMADENLTMAKKLLKM